MDRMQKWIGIILLCFSVGFNLWLYRAEPTTKIDPNDNAFQYALVERTNQIWDYALKTCQVSRIKYQVFSFLTRDTCIMTLLTDHWVPNWAEGYNLPYYYSHIPQILIVGSYRLVSSITYQVSSIFSFMTHDTWRVTLFTYYHYIIYLLLCFFPLSLFLAFRILKFPWLTAGIAAIFASQISTDGLYGIDQSSFLWRGWGLSSQLFALIWLPLAIASMIRYGSDSNDKCQMINDKSKKEIPKSKKLFSIGHLAFSIVFLTATTAGHLGIGMMTFLAIPILYINKNIKITIKQTVLLAIPPLIILSYWIVPAFLNNNFHNISVWDPVWKFNSFGAKEAVTMLVNGQLFDFGRSPIFTVLVFIGLFATILNGFPHIAFLFFSFLLLFFGRTTWGGILNLIPGMSEFHGHRFLVGVHLAGLFLAPIGLEWIASRFRPPIKFIIVIIFIIIIFSSIAPQTLRYAQYNTVLINQANEQYGKAKPDFDLLLATLKDLEKINPGRVYALRANEGKEFQIASTPYYMALSTYGIPTVLWLPETWSINSDTEQFFSEDNPSHYNLYNIRYVVTPVSKQPQPFWKLLKETEHWKLYETNTDGYIGIGTAPSIVTTKKTDLINLIHLWIQSEYPKQSLFPELRLRDSATPRNTLPHFSMLDPVTYQTPDGISHSLFAEVPVYENPKSFQISNFKFQIPASVISQSSDSDMVFKATVEIKGNCSTCVVILKQTYHPNWRVTVNGKKETAISIFPFFTAVRLEQPGIYEVVFSYVPKFHLY